MAQPPRQSAPGRTSPGAGNRPLRRRTKPALQPAARNTSRSSGRPCRLPVLASVAAAIARELAHWHATLTNINSDVLQLHSSEHMTLAHARLREKSEPPPS